MFGARRRGGLGHGRAVFRYFAQADLVNLFGRQVRGGELLHGEGVTSVAVGQGPQAGFAAAVRRVVFSYELGEPGVRRSYAVADSFEHLLLPTRLLGDREAGP